MSIEITLGWWLLPTLITIFGFFIANNYEHYIGGYINIDLEGMFRSVIWIIVSLISWLIWALL